MFLAAERILLAWIRTSIAMMGLEFLVAKFGLFVREMLIAFPEPAINVVTDRTVPDFSLS